MESTIKQTCYDKSIVMLNVDMTNYKIVLAAFQILEGQAI